MVSVISSKKRLPPRALRCVDLNWFPFGWPFLGLTKARQNEERQDRCSGDSKCAIWILSDDTHTRCTAWSQMAHMVNLWTSVNTWMYSQALFYPLYIWLPIALTFCLNAKEHNYKHTQTHINTHTHKRSVFFSKNVNSKLFTKTKSLKLFENVAQCIISQLIFSVSVYWFRYITALRSSTHILAATTLTSKTHSVI